MRCIALRRDASRKCELLDAVYGSSSGSQALEVGACMHACMHACLDGAFCVFSACMQKSNEEVVYAVHVHILFRCTDSQTSSFAASRLRRKRGAAFLMSSLLP